MRIADLRFAVSCCFDSTRTYCAEYLTGDSESADLRICITEEDISAELAKWADDPAGPPALRMIENLVLCRRIAEWLPERDRVLFHCSSLALDGQGVLFTAKSGTGKSTHTRLWREVFGDRVTMINDDKPFLRIDPDGVTVFGTPWKGKHKLGQNTSAPVKAVCFICRGAENRLEPLSPREALPMLMEQTFYPEEPAHVLRTLALMERLSKDVPIYRLYCNMDPQAAEVARAGINI